MDEKQKLIIYGAGDMGGQFAHLYRDLGKYRTKYELVGFIDDFKKGEICGFPIRGTSKKEDLQKLLDEGINHIFISLLLNPEKRLEKFLEIKDKGFKFPSLTNFPSDEERYFPKEAKIGEGILIHQSANFLGYNFDIGDFSVISANAVVERSKIGKGVIINPNTFIGYDSKIGDATIFFPYSSVNPGVTIGSNCVIYPYALVHKDMPDGTIKKKYDKG